jgi:hypothetical protein
MELVKEIGLGGGDELVTALNLNAAIESYYCIILNRD